MIVVHNSCLYRKMCFMPLQHYVQQDTKNMEPNSHRKENLSHKRMPKASPISRLEISLNVN